MTIAEITLTLIRLRAELSSTQARAADAKVALRHVTADRETALIAAAGGDKTLGANADARARALLLLLDADPAYTHARDAHAEADRLMRMSQVELDCARDQRECIRWEIRERHLDAMALATVHGLYDAS